MPAARAGHLLLVRPTATGGLSAHVDQERDALRALGIDVREADVEIRPRPHLGADLRTVRTLRRALRRPGTGSAPVAVHAHGLRAGALTAIARGRASPPRLVVTLHNRIDGSLPVRAIGALLLRILARRADVVLAVSPDLAEAARRAGARDVRHAIIPATPGPSDLSLRTTGDQTAAGDTEILEVLVVARLAAQKGLPTLLDAAAEVERCAPGRVRIRIAGEGPLREEITRRILRESLPVQLLGRRADVPALLETADVVVSAADWEGQPVGLQEALHAGRAIIATDAGGTRWVTADAATLVPVGDADALARQILAHRDPRRRRTAETASRRRAAELPDARDMTDQLRAVLPPHPRDW
ncbi:MAG: glycosyltransferase [Brachybacterium sp.]|nr:glycosyltransferase [Brachybacterium sp.]